MRFRGFLVGFVVTGHFSLRLNRSRWFTIDTKRWASCDTVCASPARTPSSVAVGWLGFGVSDGEDHQIQQVLFVGVLGSTSVH